MGVMPEVGVLGSHYSSSVNNHLVWGDLLSSPLKVFWTRGFLLC